VKWTIEEADAARNAWFELYPELGFLHCYSHYYCRSKRPASRYKIYNSYTRQVETPKWDVKIYSPTTLTNRPFSILESKTKCLAFPGQGTGTDILTRAVSYLSPRLTAALAITVHDEIVLVVDEGEDAEDCRRELEETMIRAARKSSPTSRLRSKAESRITGANEYQRSCCRYAGIVPIKRERIGKYK
jgi:hypothetical protein